MNGLQNKLPSGSCVTFDMGYVNYEAWQSFTDNDIFYVTREKKSCKKTVLSTIHDCMAADASHKKTSKT